MTENRRRILQMLADGKMSTEEADRLIAAMGDTPVREQAVSVQTETLAQVSSVPENEVEIEPIETNGNGHAEDLDALEIDESPNDGETPKERDDLFQVGGSPRLEVQNINGRIVLDKGMDGEIRVRATFRNAPRVDYQAVQEGDTVIIKVRKKGNLSLFRSPGARLEITAPANTSVDLATSNGRIEMKGIEGSGPIRTSNGRVVLEKVKGSHDVITSNGRIEINGMEGGGELRTSNGAIEIRDAVGGFSARTSNGSIHFDGEMPREVKSKFETSNGSVKVRLQGTPSLRIDAQTSNGRLKSELPMQVISSGRSSLMGTVGDGEGELLIRTSNGSVTIE